MARSVVLSPTHADNDVLILDGVLRGVAEAGAQYGLTQPRRDLLAFTLEVLIESLREGWDDVFRETLLRLPQMGRPSQPGGVRRGDTHLSDPAPELPR